MKASFNRSENTPPLAPAPIQSSVATPAAWRSAKQTWNGVALIRKIQRYLHHNPVLGPLSKRRGLSAFQRVCGDVCEIMQVHTGIRGGIPPGPCIVVSNHLGYLDPFIIGKERPLAAISKAEVAGWPGIGNVGRQLGMIFVKRGDVVSSARALLKARDYLTRGMSVLNFPEGTTSHGRHLLPFKEGIFGLARKLNVPVVPVRLSYADANVAWVGDAPFLPHFLHLSSKRRIDATMEILAPLWPRDFSDTSSLSAAAYGQIWRRYPAYRILNLPKNSQTAPSCAGLLETPMDHDPALAYIRHGQTPFFRQSLADFTKQGSDSYAGADAVLVGVPYDGGSTYQPGSRLAPYHLRRVSAFIQSFHPKLQVDVFKELRVKDGGNVAIPPFAPAAVRELVQREIRNIIQANAVPFIVGGDHSIALPSMRALAHRHGPLAVLHVDAHLDTSGPEIWHEPFHHGTPFRHAIKEGLVAEGALLQVGIRTTWGSAEDAHISQSIGGKVISADEVQRRLPQIVEDMRNRFEDKPVYISFDVDGVDPAFAPGTGTPVPGGITSREARRLLQGLAGMNVVGMDLVEVCPSLDHSDLTSHLGAHLMYEGLAALAVYKRGLRSPN